ncbi:Glu/Leu/Phe/Val dehydrogenase dimerization domain-containing protein [Bradyrhizobium sp. USDA 4506]
MTAYSGANLRAGRRAIRGDRGLSIHTGRCQSPVIDAEGAVTVSCPIHRGDGTIAVFEGYRVQHHLTLGPTKGGTRFAASVDLGEVAALAIWMSWKCALVGLPYGGVNGGINVDPPSLSRRELEALSRRYMQEMIPFV